MLIGILVLFAQLTTVMVKWDAVTAELAFRPSFLQLQQGDLLPSVLPYTHSPDSNATLCSLTGGGRYTQGQGCCQSIPAVCDHFVYVYNANREGTCTKCIEVDWENVLVNWYQDCWGGCGGPAAIGCNLSQTPLIVYADEPTACDCW